MGYTHYFRRPKELGTPKQFKAFTDDCRAIFDFCQNELGIALADGMGTPNTQPIITKNELIFNGSDAQPIGIWTTTEKISIPWPSAMASVKEPSDMPFEKTDGEWYAGDLVSQRVAPLVDGLGSGSYETLLLERVFEPESWQEPDEYGMYFAFCKTAYRPYDLTVTAVLLSLKHHFPQVDVSTDGEEKDWLDGRMLCFNLFGYGFDEVVYF